jgi:hypothetical protein
MDAVQGGMRGQLELMETHPKVMAKYPTFCRTYLNLTVATPDVPSHPLRDWQQKVNNILKLPANPRSIMFVVDRQGNAGKSWFADYFKSLHENVQILEMGKKADVALAVNPETRVFFFDLTRETTEFMNYSVLESLKNGRIFSPKYESSMVYLAHVPHVVVLTNQCPDMTKLSADRYCIIDV